MPIYSGIMQSESQSELEAKALKMLRCNRDGVSTLLGMTVVRVAFDDEDETKLPLGLQQYITKLRDWARSKRDAAEHRANVQRQIGHYIALCGHSDRSDTIISSIRRHTLEEQIKYLRKLSQHYHSTRLQSIPAPPELQPAPSKPQPAPSNAQPAPDDHDDNEVMITSERSREQRDIEGRKHAIDLEDDGPPKKARPIRGTDPPPSVPPSSLPDLTTGSSRSGPSEHKQTHGGSAGSCGSIGAAGSRTVGDALAGMGSIDGLEGLMAGLPAHVKTAAARWCAQTDTGTVQVLLYLHQEEEFIRALPLKAGGNNETLVRERLVQLRQSM